MSNAARRTIIQIFMIVIGYMFGVIYQAHAAQRTILNAALNGGSYPWDTARADLNNNFDDCYVLVDNVTVTAPVNLNTMDSLIDANVLQISEFVTLSGRPAHSTDLGTFTGTTIPDNSDNKEALQALETAVEEKANNVCDVSSLANNEYCAEITTGFNAGEAINQWDLVLLDATTGEYIQADANDNTRWPASAVAVEAGTDGNPLRVFDVGKARNVAWSFTRGDVIYLSTTAGSITATAPNTTDDCYQPIGRAMATDIVRFNINDITGYGEVN